MNYELPKDTSAAEFKNTLDEIKKQIPKENKIHWILSKISEDIKLFETPRSGNSEPALKLLAYDGIITELARDIDLNDQNGIISFLEILCHSREQSQT